MKDYENISLRLMCFLQVIEGVDTDNAAALREIPIAIHLAVELAEQLHEAFIEKEVVKA